MAYYMSGSSLFQVYDCDDDVELYNFLPTPIAKPCGISSMLEGFDIDPVRRAAELASIFSSDDIDDPFNFDFVDKADGALLLPGCQVLCSGADVAMSQGMVTVSVVDQVQSVPKHVVSAYFGSACHTSSGDVSAYHAMVRAGVSMGTPFPSKNLSDGQLKIALDFAIGVDHWITRMYGSIASWSVSGQSCRILVIGSASESGVSGTSYGLLNAVPGLFDIELWDPYEKSSDERIGNVYYHRRRGLYDYDSGFDKYDLVFDDAFSHVKDHAIESGHAAIDPNGRVFASRDFSVKWLPIDDDEFKGKHRYEQAARINECRATKYPRRYGIYRPLPVGRCSMCVELCYMLRQDYSRAYYDYFLSTHKKCCISGHQVFSRVIRFQHECCPRTSVDSLPRLNVCARHKSSMRLMMVRSLSPGRDLYEFDDKYDLDIIAVRDVVVNAYPTGRMATIIDVPRVVAVVARSIVVRYQDIYYVTVLVGQETEVASNLVIFWHE